MSYVFYDVETTGLRKRFDQIVSFAAVRTDNDLNITDQFEVKARVSPHILPSPGAVYVTGVSLGELFDPSRPTAFEALAAVHTKLSSWGKALYLGYNSLDYDEEMLRHGFYQNLKPAYLTSTNGNARADILSLCRVTAVLRPDVLVGAPGAEGRPVFRLAELAAANGLMPTGAHSAMVDVMTTLSISRHIKRRAPDLWTQFSRFATKPAVESFIANEEAFVFFDARAGGEGPFLLSPLGRQLTNPTRVYCLNPLDDLDRLAILDDDALASFLTSRDRPVTVLRTNRAPMMTEVFQVAPDFCGGLGEDEVMARANRLRTDPKLGPRIIGLLQAAEKPFPASPHVEDQLYGRDSPGWRDRNRSEEFHGSTWERRSALVREFDDSRLQRLAQRIVHFSGERLLSASEEVRLRQAIRDRLVSEQATPWLTVSGARAELLSLRADLARRGVSDPSEISDYEQYLSRF